MNKTYIKRKQNKRKRKTRKLRGGSWFMNLFKSKNATATVNATAQPAPTAGSNQAMAQKAIGTNGKPYAQAGEVKTNAPPTKGWFS